MVRTRKGRGASGRRNTGKGGRKLFYYGAELFALILLVVAAFFIPQVIFQVQDRILCGNTVLGQRESISVEALSATYEKALAVRMTNFAEGLAEEEDFYLSSQELGITDEVTEYLKGDRGILNQDFLFLFQDSGLLPYDIWTYEVTNWKQYVIYSDNYARGVNFILWYIEMENSYGEKLKLLADAEDGTLYALKTEDNFRMWDEYDVRYYNYMNFWNDNTAGENTAGELWSLFMVYYEGMTEENLNLLYYISENMGCTITELLRSYPDMEGLPVLALEYYETNYGSAQSNIGVEINESEEVKLNLFKSDKIIVGENAGYLINEKGDVSFLLPFGKGHLEIVMTAEELGYREKLIDQGIYMVPDIIIGIREIYEMIPEFT